MNSAAATRTIPAATLAAIAWSRTRDGPVLVSAAAIAGIAVVASMAAVSMAALAPGAVFAAVPPDSAGVDTTGTTDRAGIFSIFADFRAATCWSNSR